MSVLIKGMEMPESCDACKFHCYHSNGEYVCVATPLLYPFNLANSKGIRKGWCPLVEIPAPHGRIADMDEAIKCIEEVTGKDAEFAISLIEWACGKRTIIEAEGTE